jgi:hypothetical protein
LLHAKDAKQRAVDQLLSARVMEAYLNSCRVLIKDFGRLVERTTAAAKEKPKALAAAAGRPYPYVSSSQVSKEEWVRNIAHARFGFMHLRLQTWFPFQVSVCINGRHWLGKQLDEAGIGFQKKATDFCASPI